eukprot:TRINITY_DN29475_c0_g1_i1.p2 TRINITY_DN29475_c0_g1~~TRINITY_DN29475_c0_g1_i1.p2  ORF type:complete len:110 (-),score=11.12 TRINITY_DN29475_c0_g1_i1:31-360(-)
MLTLPLWKRCLATHVSHPKVFFGDNSQLSSRRMKHLQQLLASRFSTDLQPPPPCHGLDVRRFTAVKHEHARLANLDLLTFAWDIAQCLRLNGFWLPCILLAFMAPGCKE